MLLCRLLLILGIVSCALPTWAEPFSFSKDKNERIVLLGNTFAERTQYFGYFETLLQANLPDRKLTLRNMGWSGDEVALQPRPLNFGELEDHLSEQIPDVILLCFGFNESFAGESGLAKFGEDYQLFIDRLLAKQFNGKSAPRLILVSPIAQEALPAPFPNPDKNNANLKIYTDKIEAIADANNLAFIDLFTPTSQRAKGDQLTANGVHLNESGQRAVAEMMTAALGLTRRWSPQLETMRKLVVKKNEQFFFRWRPINGEYVYGRRNTPFGVLTFPPEMEEWDRLTAELDGKIHTAATNLKGGE